MSNVDINVDRRTDGRTDGLTDGRTDGRKIGRLYRTLLQAGAIKNIPPLPLPATRIAGLAQLMKKQKK